MGWKAVHPDGREIEQTSRQTVAEVIEREGGDPAEWTFSMTPGNSDVGHFIDGRPGYVGGMPIKKWQGTSG